MKILYVEDNLTNVSLVKRVARGHTLISYVDGEDALRYFERDDPDLVLMDVQLAGKMTGLDVVRKLRTDGVTVPIIAVTAYAMLGDRETCLQAGCDDYIAKPLPIPQLVEIIQKREKALQEDQSKQQVERVVESPEKPNIIIKPEPAEIKKDLEVVEQTEAQKETEQKSEKSPQIVEDMAIPEKQSAISLTYPTEDAKKTENPDKPDELGEPEAVHETASGKEQEQPDDPVEVVVQSNQTETKE